VPRAVIASEDSLFRRHSGFDWQAIGEAAEDYAERRRLRGASTISMQVTKNLFLRPGRDFVRKGVEAYLTVFVELLWSKRRIMKAAAALRLAALSLIPGTRPCPPSPSGRCSLPPRWSCC